MKPTSILSIVAVAAAMTGCANMQDFDLNKVVSGGANTVRTAIQPDVVTDYKAATAAEYKMVEAAFNEGKTIGQTAGGTNAYNEASVKFTRGANQSWSGKVMESVRIALPADAVAAHHKSASEAVEAFAAYTAKRPDAAMTKLFVMAPAAADRAWLVAQLQKAGVKGDIEQRTLNAVAIGWSTPGLPAVRVVN